MLIVMESIAAGPKVQPPMARNYLLPTQRSLTMLDKISRYAENVATSAGQSRRGFLGLLGKGALSLAGLVGACLLFRGEARATVVSGACYYSCTDGTLLARNCGSAKNPCDLTFQRGGVTCTVYKSTCGYH